MQRKAAAIATASGQLAMLPGSVLANTGVTPPVAANPAMDPAAFYIIVGVVAFVFVFGLMRVSNALAASTSNWSLTDALSEEIEKTTTTTAGEPAVTTTTKTTEMVASSSRLIALLGLMGILSLFMACGVLMLWRIAMGGTVSADATAYSEFLFYGMVMFAPYIVNKFSGVFEKFGPK